MNDKERKPIYAMCVGAIKMKDKAWTAFVFVALLMIVLSTFINAGWFK